MSKHISSKKIGIGTLVWPEVRARSFPKPHCCPHDHFGITFFPDLTFRGFQELQPYVLSLGLQLLPAKTLLLTLQHSHLPHSRLLKHH